tara:strand:+ start:508 stop:984 length:477 start_codon:yes stop_codon:yes gene_type:complete
MPDQTQLMFSSAEHPARGSRSQDSEEEWMMTVLDSQEPLLKFVVKHSRPGWSGKTCLGVFPQTEDGISVPSSERWSSSGTASATESLMHSISECHKDGDVSFLSDILEEAGDHLLRFYLSEKACKGILRRAEKRGKELPPALLQALMAQASDQRQALP